MSYKEIYPHLASKYPLDNFEIIAGVIDTYFNDLFQLDVLNNEASKRDAGGYAELFHWFMTQLDGLYTPEEVVVKINELLNDKAIHDKLLGYDHLLMFIMLAHFSCDIAKTNQPRLINSLPKLLPTPFCRDERP